MILTVYVQGGGGARREENVESVNVYEVPDGTYSVGYVHAGARKHEFCSQPPDIEFEDDERGDNASQTRKQDEDPNPAPPKARKANKPKASTTDADGTPPT